MSFNSEINIAAYKSEWLKSKNVDELHIIEEGLFSSVYSFINPKDDRLKVLKVIRKPEELDLGIWLSKLSPELKNLIGLKECPYIICFQEHSVDLIRNEILMIMDKAQENLATWLGKKKKLESTIMAKLMDSVFKSLLFAHRKKIYHKGLKPTNILITSDMNFLIADWGISRDMFRNLIPDVYLKNFDSYCIPPEITKTGTNQDQDEYLLKSDTYSFGIIILLCCGVPQISLSQGLNKLNKEKHDQDIEEKIKYYFSKEFMWLSEIVKRMCKFDIEERCSIYQAQMAIEEVMKSRNNNNVDILDTTEIDICVGGCNKIEENTLTEIRDNEKLIEKMNLSIECSLFTEQAYKLLAQAIGKISSINQLNLGFNNPTECVISDTGFSYICKVILTLKFLRSLCLSFKTIKITKKTAMSLADSLSELREVNELKLGFSKCSVSDKAMMNIVIAIKDLCKITHLQLILSRTSISNSGVVSLSEGIKHFVDLTVLYLSFVYTDISDIGIFSLCDSLSDKKKLTDLFIELNNTQIGDKSILNLADALNSLKTIENLKFTFGGCPKITQSGVGFFLNSLCGLSNLRNLKLSFRELSIFADKNLITLGESFSLLTNLDIVRLWLNGTSISEEGLIGLATAINGKSNLKYLHISTKETLLTQRTKEAFKNIPTLIVNID